MKMGICNEHKLQNIKINEKDITATLSTFNEIIEKNTKKVGIHVLLVFVII